MKRAILFRYHNNFEVCKNRIEQLATLNPGVPIFGFFGGDEKMFASANDALGVHFENNYIIQSVNPEWKWLHADIAYVKWFTEVGKNFQFEMLHIIEWDLLLTLPLEQLYQDIPADGVGLTGLVPIKDIEKKWYWLRNVYRKHQWEILLNYARSTYQYSNSPMACLGPGLCLPRKFLENLSDIEIPEAAHDELRIPLFAQILDYKLYDTHFYREWFSDKEARYFNANNKDISLNTVLEELGNPEGRRAFHPVRECFKHNF